MSLVRSTILGPSSGQQLGQAEPESVYNQIVEDEGTPVAQRATVNFTGAGVAVADAGGKTVVTVSGGAGASATTVEVDLGTPKSSGRFTITDAGISATSKVLCWQAPGPYTGKGTRADEAEMQPVHVIAVSPASGSAVVYWETPPMLAMETEFASSERLHTPGATFDRLMNQRTPGPQLIPTRIGKVRGNIRFSYVVFS